MSGVLITGMADDDFLRQSKLSALVNY